MEKHKKFMEKDKKFMEKDKKLWKKIKIFKKKILNYIIKNIMSFFCSYCNVNFTTKQNYNTHLQTKKHKKIFNIIEEKVKPYKEENKFLKEKIGTLINGSTPSPHIPHTYPTNFECDYCKQKYKTQKGKSKHMSTCMKKNMMK